MKQPLSMCLKLSCWVGGSGCGSFYFSAVALLCQFVTNWSMMKQANMPCEFAKGEIHRHALFHGFPFTVKGLKQAALQIGRSFHWPLLSSVTAVDSPIMTNCQDVFLQHKTPSCQGWLECTYLPKTTLNTAPHPPPQGIMGIWVPCHRVWHELSRTVANNANMGSKIDWKNHSNKRVWPWSVPVQSRVNSSLCFSLPSFRSSPAPLFCPRWRTEREGHLPRGRIIHCP